MAETYECDICKDEGGFLIKEPILSDGKEYVVDKWKKCDCIKQKKIKRMMKSSNLSQQFLEKSFANYTLWTDDERLKGMAKGANHYAKNFETIKQNNTEGHSLGLCGAVGSGKTHLASATANVLIKNGVQVVYFNFVNGFKEMFSLYDNGGLDVQAIRETLQKCEVLFLDDIGKGRINPKTGLPDVSKGVYDEMYGLIEHRYFNNLPMIWTSEFGLELIDMLGEATASRLMEMAGDNLYTAFYEGDEMIGKLNYRLRKRFG